MRYTVKSVNVVLWAALHQPAQKLQQPRLSCGTERTRPSTQFIGPGAVLRTGVINTPGEAHCPIFHTDRYQASLSVVPVERHHLRGKATNRSGGPSRRVPPRGVRNNTLRQQVAPLVRRTLAFANTKQGLRDRVVVSLNVYNASP